MSRIEYVRFEMQVDPPPDLKLVKDVPSYQEVKEQLEKLGFKHDGSHACHMDPGAHRFSHVVKEMECVFCRKKPCIENGRAPLGPHPKTLADKQYSQPYVQPAPWKPPAGSEAKEDAEEDEKEDDKEDTKEEAKEDTREEAEGDTKENA